METSYTFPNKAKIRFAKFHDDYFPFIEQGNLTHKIPLLLNDFQVDIAMENFNAIKWMDVPFETFCAIVTGYLSTIIKYKSQAVLALDTRSSLSYQPH